MKLSQVTQRMVNEFPEWSSVRSDEQSLGFQLINLMGNEIEDLDEQLVHQGHNYYLPTINLSEIDLIYRFELGSAFTFTSDTTDQTNPVYSTPVGTATATGTWYGSSGSALSNTRILTLAKDNNIKNLWYLAIPSRASLGTSTAASHTVLSPVAVSASPIETGLSLPHQAGKLYIKISGGTEFTKLQNADIVRTIVILAGTTRKGIEEEETLVFIEDEVKQTSKEWKELTSVKIYGLEPSSATIAIYSASFNTGPYLDFYNLAHGATTNRVDTWWGISSNNTSLEVIRPSLEDSKSRLLGFSVKNAVRSAILQDPSGTTIPAGRDIAIQAFSPYVWVLGDNHLWVYDKRLTYPNLKSLDKKVYDSEARIVTDTYYPDTDPMPTIYFRLVRPIKEVTKSRITVLKPDATKVGVKDGAEVGINTDLWVLGTIDQNNIQQPWTGALGSTPGTWTITFEVVFSDGTTTYDQRILTLDSKKALAQFNISSIIGGSTGVGIDFDSDSKLWVLAANGTKYRIDFAYDNMLIDYDQKVVYLRDAFSTLVVVA